MTNEQTMERVSELLEAQYGVSILDVDEDQVVKAVQDGDEPQAIVDDLAGKFGLKRIPGTLGPSHVDSLVLYWRELMVKVFGQAYADAVTDETIRKWLMSGDGPFVTEEDDEGVLLDLLAGYIEDNL